MTAPIDPARTPLAPARAPRRRVALRPAALVALSASSLAGGWLVLAQSGVAAGSLFFIGLVVLMLAIRSRNSKGSSAQDLARRIEAERAAELKAIRRTIGKARYLTRVGSLGERAADQLEGASDRYRSFRALLTTKFTAGELARARYEAAAEQTHLAIVDSLRESVALLEGIEAMGEPGAVDEERRALRDEQMKVVGEKLNLSERALTEFDRARVALAAVKSMGGQAEVGLDSALAELAELAERAKRYNVTT